MNTFLGLTAIIAVCVFFIWTFPPSYGRARGCTGRALQAAMEDAKKAEDAAQKNLDKP